MTHSVENVQEELRHRSEMIEQVRRQEARKVWRRLLLLTSRREDLSESRQNDYSLYPVHFSQNAQA